MPRIDVYLRSIERFGATGAILTSGQSVTLRFPTGDRHATQLTPHDQLVMMVREIAPPAVLDAIDRGKPAKFDHESGGNRFSLAVTPRQGQWAVAIDRISAEAGVAAAAAAAAGPSATLAPPMGQTSMTIERTAYELRPAAATGPVVFEELIGSARKAGASDAYLMSNALPLIRVAGEMMPLPDRAAALDAEALDKALGAIAPAEARAQWHERGDAVFAHSSADGRLRVNWIRDRRGSGASIRLIPPELPDPDALGVPELARRLIEARRGLVVIAGGAGAGKTTTAAALVEHANHGRSAMVVMVESPIEIPLDSRRCLISQREVGPHVRSLADGVRAATREGADVIVLGRADDPEALAAALDAVSAGALVVVTITAAGLAPAVERVIELSARVRGDAARPAVADALLGGVGQVLCKRLTGGRVAAFEVLVASGPVAGLVRDGKTFQLASVMQTGRPQGMSTVTDALAELVRRRVVAGDEALRRAPNPQELRGVLAQAPEA